ncbi:unnamed protein product [Rotaria socialis]
MHVPYPGAHHAIDDPSTLLVTFSPALGSGKYQYFGCPSFPVGLLSCHPSLEPPHVLPSSMSGFHVAHFEATNVLQHLSAAFSATYTSNTYCSSSNYYSINDSSDSCNSSFSRYDVHRYHHHHRHHDRCCRGDSRMISLNRDDSWQRRRSTRSNKKNKMVT